MSTENKVSLVCFNINNDKKNMKDNLLQLENPIRILNEFQEIHLFFESEKKQINSSELLFNFFVEFSGKQVIFEISILNDISFIPNICLKTHAYLIFLNLENQDSIDQLENIVTFISKYCPSENKTYLIGIYKEKINPILDKDSIENYFEVNNLNMEMYKIRYNGNDASNHKCLYQKNEMKNSKNGNKKKNNTKFNNKDNFNLNDVIEKILIKIYNIKNNLKDIDDNEYNDSTCGGNSGTSCIIG